MCPFFSTNRLTLLAAIVSAVSPIPLQAPQQHPPFIHIVTGPIAFQLHPPPLPPPPEPLLDARLVCGTIAAIIIAILFVRYLLRAVPRWLSPGEHVPRGRNSAVSQARATSPAEQRALSFDQEIASGSGLPPREATLSAPAGSTASEHRAESDPPRDVDAPKETSPLLKNNYTPSAYHEPNNEHTLTTEAGIRRERSNVDNIHPEAHEASIGGPSTLGNTETTPHNETSPSSSYPVPHKRPPLNKSLEGALAAYVISSIFIAAFGLDWAHDTNMALPGVTLDFEWLEKTCSGSAPFITLSTLTDVTHKIIYSKILEMFDNARFGTAIVLYFNGHGHGNSFLLYNDTVDAATLISWIVVIRTKTGKRNPVYIAFEHCRFESPEESSLDLGQDIHILYACMPGQGSADYRMVDDGGTYIPYSNFLKVFCLVLAETQTRPIISVDDLMLRMNTWMEKVVRMTRAEECRMSKCPTLCPLCSCPSYESCTHSDTRSRHDNPLAYPRAQNPDGMFTGFEGGVCISELLEWIEPTKPLWDRIQETAERIQSHWEYQSINVAERPESSQYQPVNSRVPRGRSTSTAQLVQPVPI